MARHQKFLPVLVPSPTLTIPLSANSLCQILAINIANDIGRNQPFCSFASFLIVSLIAFSNNPDSSNDFFL